MTPKETQAGTSPTLQGKVAVGTQEGRADSIPHLALGKGALGVLAAVAVWVPGRVDSLEADPGGRLGTWNRAKHHLQLP